jgi:hypothetical protein
MNLHEAMVEVLREAAGYMDRDELAAQINQRGLYHKRDGSAVGGFQIHGRARNYPALFVERGRNVGLTEWASAPGGETFPATARPDKSARPTSTVSEPDQMTAAELGELRRRLIKLLDAVDVRSGSSEREGVAARIARLSNRGLVPRDVAACMRTVTEMRNKAEYKTERLSPAESVAAQAAWRVIQEWAESRRL